MLLLRLKSIFQSAYVSGQRILRQSIPVFTSNCSHQMNTERKTDASTEFVDNSLDVKSIRVPVGSSFARVGYADVGPTDGPICLGLHGAPGSIDDMLILVPALTKAGIRLVVPEFPGYGNTEMEDRNAFDETTEARAELIQNFLSGINVNQVAAVMGHSMGTVVALHLAAQTDLCRSVIYLSGLGLSPHRALRPHWMAKTFAWLLANSWTEYAASLLLDYAYASRGFNISSEFGLKTGIMSVATLNFEQIQRDVESIQCKKLPMLFAMSQNDRLIEWQLPVELARRCGATDQQISYFDADERITSGPAPDDTTAGYPRVFVFARGGHFIHRSHYDVITQSIIRLVSQVSADDSDKSQRHPTDTLTDAPSDTQHINSCSL